jgi:hypothetical protein
MYVMDQHKHWDQVFLRVKPHKSSIKFGKGAKLSPRFVGPFKVVEKKGPMAYQLALPDSLMCMHNVFYVYVLRHYISDPTHVIDMSYLQVLGEGAITTETICILDHCIRQLWHQIVDQSRSSGIIIVQTWLSGRMHMICVSSFLTCLID